MRISVISFEDAKQEVKEFLNGKGLNWNGEKYIGKYTIKDSSADCCNFPCPRQLDNWSGETSALYVEDENLNEVFAVAYWE